MRTHLITDLDKLRRRVVAEINKIEDAAPGERGEMQRLLMDIERALFRADDALTTVVATAREILNEK